MTPQPATAATDTASSAAAASRPVLAAGWSLLAICALHTLAFSLHPYWDDWLAGPFRRTAPTADEAAQFWGLPGGMVVPGALLALMILRQARRGLGVPAWVGGVLGAWALGGLWVVGPSGFVLLLVPAVLLLVGARPLTPRSAAARRRSPAGG